MNKSLKLLALLMCLCSLSFAQTFQGKATYKTYNNMKFDIGGFEGMNPDMQAQVQAMLKKQMEKEYDLSFDKKSSLYTLKESLETSSPQQGGVRLVTVGGAGQSEILYKNSQEKRYSSARDMMGKDFLVKDDLTSIDWKLTKETKQIGKYTCYKAVYDREQETFQSVTIDNEEKGETERTLETITVEAWYAPEIPVSHGPEMYWGLPGLIMEIKDGTRGMMCTQVVLNPKEKVEIAEPTKGKALTESEYEAVMEEKMAEMEKMNAGGKQKGNSHSIRIRAGG